MSDQIIMNETTVTSETMKKRCVRNITVYDTFPRRTWFRGGGAKKSTLYDDS